MLLSTLESLREEVRQRRTRREVTEEVLAEAEELKVSECCLKDIGRIEVKLHEHNAGTECDREGERGGSWLSMSVELVISRDYIYNNIIRMKRISIVAVVAAFFTSTLAISIESSEPVPTAIFHGFGDSCYFPGMYRFTNEIANLTGSYATCVEIGWGSPTSIFENFQK